MLERRTISVITCAWVLAGALGVATASTGPRFDLDRCTWFATHVVVATEGASIDGRFTVIESWVGPLAPGAEIHLPKLSAFAPIERRKVPGGASVTGARMVLFLKHHATAKAWTSASYWGEVGEEAWGYVEDSVCWIEDGKAYAIGQQMNSVGTFIGPLARTESAIRAHVLQVREAKSALAEIRTREGVEPRLAEAAKFIAASNLHVRREAFDVIQACGKAAIPFLVSLLDPEGNGRHDWLACGALGAIGDPSAVRPLADLLEVEFAFWKEAKETLREGWWTPWRAADTHQRRCDRVHGIVRALEEIAAPGYEDVVRRTRALWASAPALRDAHYGRIVLACDAALGALARKQPAAK